MASGKHSAYGKSGAAMQATRSYRGKTAVVTYSTSTGKVSGGWVKMTDLDARAIDIVATHRQFQGVELWEMVMDLPADHWGPNALYDWQVENSELYDEFISALMASSGLHVPIKHIGEMLVCYDLSLVGFADNKDRQVRHYQTYYENVISDIAESIEGDVATAGESPDSELTTFEIEKELARFKEETRPPKFL